MICLEICENMNFSLFKFSRNAPLLNFHIPFSVLFPDRSSESHYNATALYMVKLCTALASTTTSSTVVAYSALLRPKRVGNDRYSPNIKVLDIRRK